MKVWKPLEEAYSDKSYTFVQDLQEDSVNSVKAVACKKQTTVKVSTRFISAKLLINAKISLASFIYDCIDRFCFPNEKTQKIYDECKILKVLPYLLKTDTDSATLEFIGVADNMCDLGGTEMKQVLWKTFLDNYIHKRLDRSSKFFEQFSKRNESIRKQVGLREFGIICAICVNFKEYFELYSLLYQVNKKHKEVRKGTKGMDFDDYPGRILDIDEPREGASRFAKKNNRTSFWNKKGDMYMVTTEKGEFGQLNDKRYLSCDGISSLPYAHQDLNAITEFKDSLNLTPQGLIKYHKNNLLRFEQGIIQWSEPIKIINAIFTQQSVFYKKGTMKRSQFQIKSTSRDFVLKDL